MLVNPDPAGLFSLSLDAGLAVEVEVEDDGSTWNCVAKALSMLRLVSIAWTEAKDWA